MNIIFERKKDSPLTADEQRRLLKTEWLVTNAMGGYASGTLSGTLTRVFHGYLIAALSAPLGRTMMLNDVLESIITPDDQVIHLNGLETEGGEYSKVPEHLVQFRLESGMPVWTFQIGGTTIEKRLCVPHCQNTTYITYRVISGPSLELQLRPLVNMREHEASVATPLGDYTFTVRDHHFELKPASDIPPLRLKLVADRPAVTIDPQEISNVVYDVERGRGYTWRGNLWSPGYFTVRLKAEHDVSLVVSTETWDVLSTLSPQEAWDAECDRKRRLLVECEQGARDAEWRELVWAADQFIFRPVGRQQDTARARAMGDEVRSIIAGYHWFTDWGRDTMISLEGLTLMTGRHVEASYILRTFAHYIRNGLIPNMFPEGKTEGLYHTADATLWFFHAAGRYFDITGDRLLMNQFLPYFLDIVKHHLEGTRFNIHVDPKDGLLIQGAPGYQLTWMDAKVEDWVVTPRRGKAVEINALWYNALRLLESWLRKFQRGGEADSIAAHADRAYQSFNEKFWNPDRGYLYDVVESENGKNNQRCRPNQIFAISLDHPVLEESKWEPVVQVVKDRLLTPFGLRSLAPGERDYKPNYDGDLRARDAAYHQGTVWAWLIGPFIDAWLRVHPNDFESARNFLSGFFSHRNEACVGSISEIFDAEPPFTPRGCCAQAWSVAEVLRAFVKTGEVTDAGYEACRR